jgi:uncharacterized membrane protein YbhN (UPF0104 family)
VWALHRFGAPALALLARGPRTGLLLAFAAVVGVVFVAWGMRWRLLLAGLGARGGLPSLTAHRAAAQSVSALVPSAKLGGEPLRAYLLVRDRVPAAAAIASVAVDRTLEMGAAAPFACLYAALLLRRGVPELEGAFVTVSLGAGALALGIALAARRLRRGAGLVTAVARSTGLDRLPVVQGRLNVLAEAEAGAARLVGQPARLAAALGLAVAANLLVLLEYHLLLSAGPLAVVAAIFAAGAAHSLPVPAAVGVLEGAQMWLFAALGHPLEVGLAVGLAVRLRELVWILPGLGWLLVRAVGRAGYGRRPQAAAARNPG